MDKKRRMGGYYVEPQNGIDLFNVARFLNEKSIDYIVIGHTSNLYFYNTFDIDVILSTRNLKNITEDKECIICDCGVPMKKLSEYCIQKGYKGYEGFIQLPGTVGAAVFNNAGCFNCQASDILLDLVFLKSNNEIITITNDEMKYSKRSSILKRKDPKYYAQNDMGLIISVRLKKEIDSRGINYLIDQANKNKEIREKTQEPPLRTLGSVFSNLSYKKIPRIIISLVNKFSLLLNIHTTRKNRIIKMCLLLLFGSLKLNYYISDYTLNCFIWKDEHADEYFNQYVKFIENITYSRTMEIEIKS